MTACEAMARAFVVESEREAEHCLPFLLATLRPLEGKTFETLEASTLARERLRYGCSYWNVRDMLLCGVRTCALEFLNGRFKLKDTSRQAVDLDAWRNAIKKFLGLKKKIFILEKALAESSPEYVIEQAQKATDKLAENFCRCRTKLPSCR